jgi:hypothetical protein
VASNWFFPVFLGNLRKLKFSVADLHCCLSLFEQLDQEKSCAAPMIIVEREADMVSNGVLDKRSLGIKLELVRVRGTAYVTS